MDWLIIAGRSKQGRRPPNEKTTTKRETAVSEWERLGEDFGFYSNILTFVERMGQKTVKL